jgi:hypothetical protein
MSAFNLLFLASSGGLFLAFLRRGLGISLPIALSVTVLSWISPSLWRVALVPLSEPLFLVFLLLALWAGASSERREGARAPILFLLLGGLAFYTRSMGAAVLVGGAGALFLRRRKVAGIAVTLGVLCLVTPWVAWSRWAAGTLPEPLRDTLGPYGGWLLGEISGNPMGYAAFLLRNGTHLLGRIMSLLLPGVTGAPLWLGVLLLPVLVLGLRELSRRTLVLPLTLAVALLVLLLWPFQEIRLLVPLLPLLFLGVGVGLQTLLGSGLSSLWIRIPLGVLGGGWMLMVLSVSVYRILGGWPGEAYRVRSTALTRAVQAVQEKTPPEAVVGAPELWSGLHLFTGRTVSPSARFLPLASDSRSWGTPEEQYGLWIEAGITHLLVEHGGRVHGEALDRMDRVCAPGSVQVLDLQPGQALVALGWDSECRAKLAVAEEGRGSGP